MLCCDADDERCVLVLPGPTLTVFSVVTGELLRSVVVLPPSPSPVTAAAVLCSATRLVLGHSSGLLTAVDLASPLTSHATNDTSPLASAELSSVQRIRSFSKTSREMLVLHDNGTSIAIATLVEDFTLEGALILSVSVLAVWRFPFVGASDVVSLPHLPMFPHVLATGDLSSASTSGDSLAMLVSGRDPMLAILNDSRPITTSQPQIHDNASSLPTSARSGVASAVGRTLVSLASWWLAPSPAPSSTTTTSSTVQTSSTTIQTASTAIPALHVQSALRDERREVVSLVPSPSGRFVAAADCLGRVLVVDTAAGCTILRVLKGYRDAVCGWLGDESHELLSLRLAIYVPRLSIIDIWQPLSAAPQSRITLDNPDSKLISIPHTTQCFVYTPTQPPSIHPLHH